MRRYAAPFVTLALALSTGCASQGEPYHVENQGARVAVDLVLPAPDVDRAAVEAVWSDLWAGMAADPESQALIRRLYSDLPVVLEGPSAPAASADSIRLRVSDLGTPELKDGYPAGVHVHAIRDIRLQADGPRGVHLNVEAPAGQEPGEALVDAMMADVEVLRLAAAEYVARKLGAPWKLVDGPIEPRLDAFCRRFRWSIQAE